MDGEQSPRATVAAVLVAHDGATWLPKVLNSLSTMDVAPVGWHAVDVSSTDQSADFLRQSFGESRISFAPAGTGFGDAVRIALEQLPQTEWIWLLHDDAIVTPGTLSGLLAEASASPDIAVVGPKIREWPSLVRLLEVGVTITGTGSRSTGLEPGEPDAGQYDRPRTVLAVSSAGMLVRRQVWDALGGFDPHLPLYFDDIDFCWRVSRAGHRVRTAPHAVIFHAEASSRGSRRRSAGDVPTWEHRRAALHTLLANTSSSRFAFQYVRMLIGSLLRVLGFLLDREPEAAGDELLALRDIYGRRGHLRAARRARAPFALRPHTEIAKLLPPWWLPYRHGLDVLSGAFRGVVKPESRDRLGRRSTLGDQLPDDLQEFDDGESIFVRHPWFSAALVLALAALVVGRGLLGGELHSPALPPPPTTAGGWWSLIFARSHDAGLASTAFGPPYALILALGGTLLWWWPGVVVKVLLLGAVPLAALTAHRVGRVLIEDRKIRIVWAATYGLLVVATGAVAQGRIGTVVALIVAPVIVNAFLKLIEEPGWQAGLHLGIWTATAAAFAPIVFWLVTAAATVIIVTVRPAARRPLVIAACVCLVLSGPWAVLRLLRPDRVWLEAGHPVPGHADVFDVLTGTGGGTGALPVGATAVVILLALIAFVPAATREAVRWCWSAALLGLAGAVLGLLVTQSTPAGQSAITPWVGVPAALWIASLTTAIAIAAQELGSYMRPIVVGFVVAALIVPAGLAAWWVVRGVGTPLTTAPVKLVPAYLAARPGSTLVVTGSVEHGVMVRVVEGAGPTLGQEAVIRDTDKVAQAVRDLMGSPYGDGPVALAKAGVEAVYAPHADPALAARFDAVPVFAPAGGDRPGSRVWTIDVDQRPDVPHRAGTWRWFAGGLQTLVWIVAIITAAPVRRHEQPGEIVDDAPFVGSIGPAAGAGR
jgi:GT2 family glycosyltransferase